MGEGRATCKAAGEKKPGDQLIETTAGLGVTTALASTASSSLAGAGWSAAAGAGGADAWLARAAFRFAALLSPLFG